MKTNQSGRSMVEMLGVLAIIGVLSVGGIAGYSKAMNKYKLNKFVDQLSNIISGIITSYSGTGSLQGLDNATVKKLGLVPESMYESDSNAPKNSWGGYINFAASSQSLGYTTIYYDGIFYVQTNKIPKDVCITLLTADWGSNLHGMGSISDSARPMPSVNPDAAATETYAKSGDETYPTPFSMVRAEQVCSANPSTGMNLFWYFKI